MIVEARLEPYRLVSFKIF